MNTTNLKSIMLDSLGHCHHTTCNYNNGLGSCYRDGDECRFDDSVWDSVQGCDTARTTYNTVQFCEEYQRKYRKNIDWAQALCIARTGGGDHCPRHKATLTINGHTVEFEDYLAKKECKARAIALWQERYAL